MATRASKGAVDGASLPLLLLAASGLIGACAELEESVRSVTLPPRRSPAVRDGPEDDLLDSTCDARYMPRAAMGSSLRRCVLAVVGGIVGVGGSRSYVEGNKTQNAMTE